MIILVTGGTGLVGKALQQVCTKDDQWIFLGSQDADLTNLEQTEQIFIKYKPTHIIHLAAYVGGLFKNMKYRVDFWRYNILINENILYLSHKYNVKKLISCLSTCIFPDKTTYPIDETMIHNGPPHSSNLGYAYAKRMIDIQNKLYYEQYGCNFTSIISTNIYGPYDNFHLEDSHVIPGLIHKCYLAKKNNTPFLIMGSGKPMRQFIYSEDLAHLIIWVLKNYDNHEPIILSVGEQDEITIKDVVDHIVKAMDFKGQIIWDFSSSDGQIKKTASNTKLMSMYPNLTFTPIEIGIKKVVDWFITNYESANIRL